jgi:hypothetical protein
MPEHQPAPLSIQEWRAARGREDLTDAELTEFVESLRAFLGQFLDEYFREEVAPDDV